MGSGGYSTFGACVLICLLLAARGAAAAVPCGVALGAVGPCISYVTGRVSKPTPFCCAGVRRLNSLAKTTADRQAGCACLKIYAAKIKGLVGSRVSALPGACGVKLPFSISPSINCKTIP